MRLGGYPLVVSKGAWGEEKSWEASGSPPVADASSLESQKATSAPCATWEQGRTRANMRHSARQTGQLPGQAPRPAGHFLGKPISPVIIGSDIGLNIPSFNRGCLCPISTAFPGRIHSPFECPIKYHATLSGCPGWTAVSTRIPACWNGDDLTDACRAEWRTFVRVLPCSKIAQGTEVAF